MPSIRMSIRMRTPMLILCRVSVFMVDYPSSAGRLRHCASRSRPEESFPPARFETPNRQEQKEQCHADIKDEVPGIQDTAREILAEVQRHTDIGDDPVEGARRIHFRPPKA